MFLSNCRRCSLSLNLRSFVLNISKSYMLCHLALTQSDFLLNMAMCLARECILVISNNMGYCVKKFYP
ncbi:hypothetical protein Hanom_Chr08g00742091 [Helianthus anomalus]